MKLTDYTQASLEVPRVLMQPVIEEGKLINSNSEMFVYAKEAVIAGDLTSHTKTAGSLRYDANDLSGKISLEIDDKQEEVLLFSLNGRVLTMITAESIALTLVNGFELNKALENFYSKSPAYSTHTKHLLFLYNQRIEEFNSQGFPKEVGDALAPNRSEKIEITEFFTMLEKLKGKHNKLFVADRREFDVEYSAVVHVDGDRLDDLLDKKFTLEITMTDGKGQYAAWFTPQPKLLQIPSTANVTQLSFLSRVFAVSYAGQELLLILEQ